jgi:hypothetical protein
MHCRRPPERGRGKQRGWRQLGQGPAASRRTLVHSPGRVSPGLLSAAPIPCGRPGPHRVSLPYGSSDVGNRNTVRVSYKSTPPDEAFIKGPFSPTTDVRYSLSHHVQITSSSLPLRGGAGDGAVRRPPAHAGPATGALRGRRARQNGSERPARSAAQAPLTAACLRLR